ncbi:RNA-binding protein 42 [Loxospora ochrophaea]|nr:RNA-binding protein 42 [Loxospora ochrophaea]
MSYPPPPGLKSSQAPPSSSTPQPHASLPPRPPPPSAAQPTFKPAFASGAPGTRGYSTNEGTSQPQSSYTGFTGFQPRSVAAHNQPLRTQSPIVSVPPAPPTGFSAPQPSNYGNPTYQTQPSYQQPPTPSYYQQPLQDDSSYPQPTPPQIRNPFPLPGQEGYGRNGRGPLNSTDPELEAQIAQWQSAYASKEDNSASRGIASRSINRGEGALSATGANSGPLGIGGNKDVAMSNSDMNSAANADSGVAAVITGADGKQKTVVRSGGGQTWQDPSLLEWDPAHFRLFVGNLAGEVTDESLLKAFAKFPTVQKARVVRDKRTTKSKGYGFVSFSDGEEYFQAARDMQGKYIGSHPVLVKKSTTEIRPTVPGSGKKGKGGKGGGGGAGGKMGHAGVQKKGGKTKGGLRVLG